LSDRTVLASFYSAEEAKQAVQQIKQLGIEVAQIDELHAFAGTMPKRQSFIISGDIPSLAALTLNTPVSSRDAGVLLAADASASGMTDGQDNVTGRNYLMTVVCPELKVEQVVSHIKMCNGYT